MRRGESSSTVTAISYRCPRVVVGSGEGAEINKEEETKNNNCEATFPFPAKVLFLYSAISFTSSLPLSPFSNRGDLLTHSTPGCAITTTPSKSPPSPIITSIYISNLVITKKKKRKKESICISNTTTPMMRREPDKGASRREKVLGKIGLDFSANSMFWNRLHKLATQTV